MKRIFKLMFVLLPTLGSGQHFNQMDTLITFPPEITSKVNQEIEDIFHVDFTGDNIKDYIVQTKVNEEGKTTEIWLTSDFSLFNRTSTYRGDYYFIRFINLDDDPEPEIYLASGYSDGIDYEIYDLNMKTGKQELLFYFNPVIIDNEKKYWGYPWDTSGIITKNENGKRTVYCSLRHDIERDGEITRPDNQNFFPVIFLKGQSTQPDFEVTGIETETWKTIEEIKNICTTTPKKTWGGK